MNCSQSGSESSSPEEGWCQHYLSFTRKNRRGEGRIKDLVSFGLEGVWLCCRGSLQPLLLASTTALAAKAGSEQEMD